MATTTEIRQHIAAEVRAELARQRRTQREVATCLGMVQPVMQLRLSGQRSFKAEELVQLAELLGVPVGQFASAPAVAATSAAA